jgi:hypothetical protein
MDTEIPRGTRQFVDGAWRVFYDGYWIKEYEVPADTLLAKKRLIEALTRRLFNHVEHGLNVPGSRLEEARRAFESETDPQRKRVKGAMLAGALFNRATDMFTKLVDIQALGCEIRSDNALMRQCGEHLKEALSLGRMVLHRSGEEGIDELWGEPFKAFAYPIEEFYRSRYVKIAQAMGAIDRIAGELSATIGSLPMFAGIDPLVQCFAGAAKLKCETLRTECDVFDVWASFVVAAERLSGFQPHLSASRTPAEVLYASQGLELIRQGKDLVSYIARARVTMPKSARELMERCQCYRAAAVAAGAGHEPAALPDADADTSANTRLGDSGGLFVTPQPVPVAGAGTAAAMSVSASASASPSASARAT